MNLNKTFRNLPSTQAAVFEQIAIGNDAGHDSRTLAKLLNAELITRTEQRKTDTFGEFVIYRYEVPLPVHMEWCAWCAEQER